MPNALYPLWKLQLYSFTANNNLSTGDVKVALIDTTGGTGGYTYNPANQFFSSVPGTAIVGTPVSLASKTFTIVSNTPVFDAGDVTFNLVTGDTVEALLIYIDTGTAATSPLVAYIDTDVTGLPVTPNGGNISITWNASGIFAL
jgi:hypothetical protein